LKRYIYGLDPASQDDFFGIIVHELPDIVVNNVQPLPILRHISKPRHKPFDVMLEYITRNLFQKMPPYYVVIDYTNERTFTDMLVRDYGEERIETVKFGASLSGTKKMLKDDGLAILKQGYNFPDHTTLPNPETAQMIRELIVELKHEEMTITRGGVESFSHPIGRHNDTAIAWELSIHGCLKHMLHAQSDPMALGAGNIEIPNESVDEISELLGKPHIKIKETLTRLPAEDYINY